VTSRGVASKESHYNEENPCALPAILVKEPTISPSSLQPKGEELTSATPLLVLTSYEENV
jgi:hypothetical protein